MKDLVLAMTPEGTIKTADADNVSDGSMSDGVEQKLKKSEDRPWLNSHPQKKKEDNLVIPEEDEYCSCDEDHSPSRACSTHPSIDDDANDFTCENHRNLGGMGIHPDSQITH